MLIKEVKGQKEILNIMHICSGDIYDQTLNNEEVLKLLSLKFASYGEVFAALIDNVVAGFVSYYCNDIRTKTGFLSMIVVRENYQSNGLGKILLDQVIERCRLNGMKKLSLEVDKKNVRAINFYCKNYFFLNKKTNTSFYFEKEI